MPKKKIKAGNRRSMVRYLADHPMNVRNGKKGNTRAVTWYNSQRWDLLWNDFICERTPDGSLKYPTIWSFIQVKWSADWERRIAQMVIGPPPVQMPGEKDRIKLPVKHLGDWQKVRAATFYYGDETLDRLTAVINNKKDALEAGRSIAYISQELIAQHLKYVRQIDSAFDGQAVVPGASIKDNDKRAAVFFRLMNRANDGLYQAMESFLNCHGVGKDNLSVLAQMAMVASVAAASGAVAGTVINENRENTTLRLLMETVMDKSKTLDMPLPALQEVQEQEEEKVVKKNGHGKVN